ncbi:hypothetical protein SAY86_021450 [Trapa natans]|uniref:DYW domain-containing protein n=1 Tax=Trapa natans TaxID=22666 RepID=A0AAN7MZ50_TRANT|nr:hypothetical protein SAY86_021450 [Trapa natans]
MLLSRRFGQSRHNKLVRRLAGSLSFDLIPDRKLNPIVNRRVTEQSCLSLLQSCCTWSDADTKLYDTFLFNTIIRSYALNKDIKAVHSLNWMLNSGYIPNEFTYPFVLKACAGIGDLRLGQAVHGSAVKFGFKDNSHVMNTLVHMYGSCARGITFARNLFDKMQKQDSVSWSVMMGVYVRAGEPAHAVELFRKMQVSGFRPDEVTMILILSACADLGALECGKWIESFIMKEKIKTSIELYNSLIDMFAKCGDMDSALRVFRGMDDKTIVSWTSVIGGMAMHGFGLEAVSLFEEMMNVGFVPDEVAFIGILSACSHSGLVQEGQKYFYLMKEKFGIQPKIEHYGCVVDSLCRARLVKEAVEFVDKMPIAPNSIIWRTLTSACRAQEELELGERISARLVKEEPRVDANYVLLSNIYAKMSCWEKKTQIREEMDIRGLRKVPGTTLIELHNEIYEFVAGDKSHDQYKEICEMLDEMGKEMKRAGYSASISEILLDIDDEDKEDALNRHSEKLAIAFALMRTPPGAPIRIVKNLRVCIDCHSATKFISKIYKREILVRDRNRFHHFKDGVCSCRDFW